MKDKIKILKNRWDRVYYRKKKGYYLGNNFCCPVCGSNLKVLLDGSGCDGVRSVCPLCASNREGRTLYFFMAQVTELFSRKLKILDLSRRVEGVAPYPPSGGAVDFSRHDLSGRGKDCNLYALDYPDGYFDLIICNNLLDMIYNEKFFLKELERMMNKGGFVLLQSDIDLNLARTFESEIIGAAEKKRLYGDEQRLRRYGKDYLPRLRGLGYRLNEYNFTPYHYNSIIKKYALEPNYRIYLLTKVEGCYAPKSLRGTATAILSRVGAESTFKNGLPDSFFYLLMVFLQKSLLHFRHIPAKFSMNEEFSRKWLYQFYAAGLGAALYQVGRAIIIVIPLLGLLPGVYVMGVGAAMPVFNLFGGEASLVKRWSCLISFFVFLMLFSVLTNDFAYYIQDLFARLLLLFLRPLTD